jgi:succinate-acetate transporter protein
MADSHFANPAPLGLAGFGLTTVVLSCMNAGLFPAEAGSVVVPLAFAYGGLAQIIAGIMEYRNGNTFGTVAFTSYGTFWWWYALLLWTVGAGWIKPPDPAGIGITLLMWGVFTFYMWIATFRTNTALWLVFLTLWIAFFLLAGGGLGMGMTWHKLGGWDGMLCGTLALYLSFAEVTNATWGRAAIPVGGPIIRAANGK